MVSTHTQQSNMVDIIPIVRNDSATVAVRLFRRLIEQDETTKTHIYYFRPDLKPPQYSAVNISGLYMPFYKISQKHITVDCMLPTFQKKL